MSPLSALHGASSTILSNIFVTLPAPSQDSDLSKQIIIVTGSNTGLGLEASRHLSRLGPYKLIMAVRNPAKGEEARKNILASTGKLGSSIEVWALDMDSYDSVKAFASRASQLPRLDGVLVTKYHLDGLKMEFCIHLIKHDKYNPLFVESLADLYHHHEANAGVMTNNFALSEGIEKTLNVNVVSTFLLYLLILPKMRNSGQETGNVCRYVIPNSALHYMAPLAELDSKDQGIIERLNDPKNANMAGRYPLSKLLVIYAVREFALRSNSPSRGQCIINTPNPSFCKSNLSRESQDSFGFRMFERLLARSTEEGSRALVHGLLAGKDSNGQYLTNCHVQSPSREVTGDWGQQVQNHSTPNFFRSWKQFNQEYH